MARSNFGRFADQATIGGMAVAFPQSGKTFYVSNTIKADVGLLGVDNTGQGYGIKPELPYATVSYAISQCVAGRGDVILVMPGHVETLSIAAAWALSVNGTSIIGLGEGDSKPQITLATSTAAQITVAGNGCAIKNIIFICTKDALVSAFSISGTSFIIENCETRDSTVLLEAAIWFTVTGAKFKAVNLKHRGFVAGDASTAYISMNGVAGAQIQGLDYYGIASTAVINFITTLCSDIKIDGIFTNGSTALTKNVVDTITGSLWAVNGFDTIGGYNFVGGSGAAVASLTSASTVGLGTDGTTVTDSATTVLGAIGANNSANAFSSASVVATRPTGSVLERLAYLMAQDSQSLVSGVHGIPATVSSPGTTAITIAGGPIIIEELSLEITTVIANTACGVSFALTDTASSTTTLISGVSSSIATMAVGAFLRLDPVALSTSPVVSAVGGAYLGNPAAGNGGLAGVHCAAGTIGIITTGSPATGQYKLHLRYHALSPGVSVTLA